MPAIASLEDLKVAQRDGRSKFLIVTPDDLPACSKPWRWQVYPPKPWHRQVYPPKPWRRQVYPPKPWRRQAPHDLR